MFVCEICKKEFVNLGGLNLHTFKKHPKDDRLFRIEVFENGKLVLSYPVRGKREVEEAKKVAERNRYEIRISDDAFCAIDVQKTS